MEFESLLFSLFLFIFFTFLDFEMYCFYLHLTVSSTFLFLLSNAQVFLQLGETDYRVWPLQSSFDKTCK